MRIIEEAAKEKTITQLSLRGNRMILTFMTLTSYLKVILFIMIYQSQSAKSL
jgi:hypothetical protein